MIRLLLLLVGLALVAPVQAAESYDNCTGVITSLPATVNTQGTWCLQSNVSTAITAGAAITVATNNVTIDCNDFKVGGLAAGEGTDAVGISAHNVLNLTVRRCGIRGFRDGIRLSGTASGALIEHNRFDSNTVSSINVAGSNHQVLFNRIIDTGGRPESTETFGILAPASESQITDNSIVGMTVTDINGHVTAIAATGNASEISRNFVSGLVRAELGGSTGIETGAAVGSSIHRNQLLNGSDLIGHAINAGADTQCGNNSHSNWDTGIVGCQDAGGNFGN